MPKLNTGASTFYTNTLASVTDGDYYEMRENGGVAITISGTWSGTISFQQSNDEQVWYSVAALAAPGTGGANVTSTTANGAFFMVVQLRYFRAVFTSYSSGTANVTARFVSDGSINYSFSGSSATGANADQIQGNVASGATDAGNPVKQSGVFNTTQPTVTSGQRVDFQATNRGEQLVVPIQMGQFSTYWSYAAAASGIVSSTADVAIKTAGGAGVRNYLKTLTIETDTLGAATEIVVKDGASTVLWRGKLQTTNASRSITFDPPLRGTANTAFNVALLTSVTGGVYVNATGFTSTQ